ncbi:hypothetical protein [Gemmatimonas sp.]|jgi:hypothetical protein|uniref:hypothetical protein n=1 Tax=Gemmatimonas sp. TaxID=1962908 RepID=UPI0037BE712E
MAEVGAPGPTSEDRTGRNIGVGCFTLFIGTVSGAMSGVGIGKLMGFFNRCTPEPGLPACEWWVYAGWGAAIGAVTLPVFTLWRLKRRDQAEDAASTYRG